MHLVLCSQDDRPALWAYRELRAAGLDSIDLVTTSALAGARSWEHRLGDDDSRLTLELPDGRCLRSAEIAGVLNRLVCPPLEIVEHAVAADREYAAAESAAFYLSWLHGLRGVINAPTPQGLCGSWRHASEWALLASRAGLEAPVFRQASTDSSDDGFRALAPARQGLYPVIVLRGRLHGTALPRAVGAACIKLAALAATDLLGIDLLESAHGALTFAHATPYPDLTLGGDELIDGLLRALGARPVG